MSFLGKENVKIRNVIRGKRKRWKKMEKKGCKKDKVGERKEKRVKKRISGEPMLEKIRYRSNEKANCW